MKFNSSICQWNLLHLDINAAGGSQVDLLRLHQDLLPQILGRWKFWPAFRFSFVYCIRVQWTCAVLCFLPKLAYHQGSSDLCLGSPWLGLYKCTCAVVCFLQKLAFYPPGSVHWCCVEQFSENSLEVLGHLVLLLLVAVVLDGEDQRVAGGGEGIRQNCIVENVLKSKTLFHSRFASYVMSPWRAVLTWESNHGRSRALHQGRPNSQAGI